MAKKQQIHKEWFRKVSMGGRKSCPTCRAKLGDGESVWVWGNYVCARWRNVAYFCRACYAVEVAQPMIEHAGPCGCVFQYVGYQGTKLPEWLTLPKECRV